MAIISISREAFSGGEALAQAVAERLGYPCVSREMNLEAAAQEYGIPATELATAMEQPPTLWERLVGERGTYLTVVAAALCAQAQEGNLVYHGHLGHLLLPGVAHVIGLRVVAELPYRLEVGRQQGGLGREGAEAYIERVDRKQRQWVRFLFGVDWEDPRLYDLVLNLSRVRLSTACEMVVRLASGEEFRSTADSERAMHNLTAASRVRALLARHPDTKGLDLQVEAVDGFVTITGVSPSEAIEAALASALEGVKGVTEIRWKITVVPHP
jgi:cytidylate kinase